MRFFLKPLILALLMAFPALAQIPVPQLNLTGSIGCMGFPCVNNGTLIFASDANHTMTAQETSAFYIKVTSSVSLTATRNLIAPTGRFPFTIENATTGGQSIQIIGQSGAGVTIPNGTTVQTWNDGTNFVQVGSAGGGGISGGTNGYVALFGSASTITAGTPVAGGGDHIVSGPGTVVNGNLPSYSGTGGGISDSGIAATSLAPKASPALTGVPTAPTAAPSTNTTQLATTAFVLANGGSGNTTSTSLSSNTVPKANGANSIINSAIVDNGTTVASSEPVSAPSLISGTPSSGALAALPTGAHGFACDESSTAGVPASGVDYVRCDSTTHTPLFSLNGAAETPPCIPGPFAAQTDAATVTWAIGSNICANASLTFTVHSGSRTLNLTGMVNGGSYVMWLKQDATGGEGLTLGTGCTWKVGGNGSGAITPSIGASAIDMMAWTYDGTNCYLNFRTAFN